MTRPLLQIIIASTRPGRVGKPIADWFEACAGSHGGCDVEVVDLAQVGLPIFDEAAHPMTRTYAHQHTQDWSATINRADGFVLVMPEYNHGYNAALKNAIDYLYHEWSHKPVGFVGYGQVAGGTRAVQAIKHVLMAVKATPVLEAVYIPFAPKLVEDGVFQATEAMGTSAGVMLDQIVKLSEALKPLRN